jgi:general stress protein 26
VRETPEELAALQRLLDRSIGRSGGHLTGIISEQRRLDARQVVKELSGMKVLVVATVNAAGEPRTSCVDGHFRSGAWLFGTDESARKARDLKARPAVSCTYVDGERVAVFTHGHAEYVAKGHPDFAAYDDYYREQYGSAPSSWTPGPVFIRVRPTWMVGYAMNAARLPRV